MGRKIPGPALEAVPSSVSCDLSTESLGHTCRPGPFTPRGLSRDFFRDGGTALLAAGVSEDVSVSLQDVLVGKAPESVFPFFQVSVSFISLPQWPHYSHEDPHRDSRQPAFVQWEPNTQREGAGLY